MSYPPPYDPNQQQPPQYTPPVSPVQPGSATPPYGQPSAYEQPAYTQPAYGQPATPPKKSKAGMIIGIILGVVLLVCVACGAGVYFFYNKASDTIEDIEASLGVTQGPRSDSHTVHYEAGGTGTALITWGKGTSGTDSATVTLPWSKDFTLAEDSFGLSVLVFGREGGDQGISCKILIDGVEKSARSGSSSAVCTAFYVS